MESDRLQYLCKNYLLVDQLVGRLLKMYGSQNNNYFSKPITGVVFLLIKLEHVINLFLGVTKIQLSQENDSERLVFARSEF